MAKQTVPAVTEFTVQMSLAKVTKGAVQFKELDARGVPINNFMDGKIGSMYVRKTALPNLEPVLVEVTVKVLK